MHKNDDVEFIDNSPDAFDVGYKRPPKHTRFKKGQSGNPKGRPKNKMSLNKIWRDVFLKPEVVTINGTQQKMPMIEATLMKQREKILQGDTAALKKLWPQLCSLIEEDVSMPFFKITNIPNEKNKT